MRVLSGASSLVTSRARRMTCVADISIKLLDANDRSQEMLNAHVKSMTLLATPFKASTPQPFAFGPGSRWADITAEIRDQIPVMLRHRLTPPPRETYSLNRFVTLLKGGLVFGANETWQETERRILAGFTSQRNYRH